MWGDGGGIANNLSREFRAMSSTRDRQWATERGSRGGSLYNPTSGAANAYVSAGRAKSPPLRYGSQDRWGDNGQDSYQPVRRYSRNDAPLWRQGDVEGGYKTFSRAPSRGDRAAGGSARPGFDRARAAGHRGRSNADADRRRRASDDRSSEEDSYSYSYSYSSSSSGSSSGDSSSVPSTQSDDRGRRAYRQRQQKGPARGSSGRPPARQVKYTPTGPAGAARGGESDGAVRWVSDGVMQPAVNEARASGTTAAMAAGIPGSAGNVGGNGRVAVMNATDPQRPVMAPQMPALQPSGLLRRVVEAVAYYRGVAVPTSIPSEVTLAFDEYVSRGSTMLKFLPHGPPHSRYFIIRFLDVVPGGMRSGRDPRHSEMTVPHAVLAWYRNTSSRHMIRFLPLHDLMEVKADGSDHPYVQRRTVQPGMLRGPRTGLSTNYVYADHILQFRFCSRLSRGEETLALKTANRTQHLAWLVVGSFISQIGGGAHHTQY